MHAPSLPLTSLHDRLSPSTSLVEFRAAPDELPAVLREMAAHLACTLGGGLDDAIDLEVAADPDGLSVRLELPGGTADLGVAQVLDPAARPTGSYTLCLRLPRGHGVADPVAARLLRAVQALPLTRLECGELQEQLPLTSGLPAMVAPGALAGRSVLLTIHHMTDFLGMVQALVALGVPPGAMTVIDKEYPYLHTRRVDAHLKRRMRIAVFRYRNLEHAIKDHADRADAQGRPSLIIDDGGYVLPVLLDRLPDLTGTFTGLVEQTTSGITKLERYRELPVPIFSVAQSQLKATVESYGIADTAIRRILALLPHEKFEGQAALVVGYGRIGQQLAEVLRARRMRVAVYDRQLVRLIAAHERGFLTSRDLPGLLGRHQPLLVVGSTGRTALHADEFAAITRSCFVASVTSRNYEFALDELAVLAVEHRSLGVTGTRYLLPSGPAVTVLADGYPVNFHYAESLPNKYVDLVLAALLVGACTLATPDHGFRPGHNVDRTDQVLDTSPVLERYYQLYGPPAC